MKKVISKGLLFFILGLTSLYVHSQEYTSWQGTITFSGEIANRTCVIRQNKDRLLNNCDPNNTQSIKTARFKANRSMIDMRSGDVYFSAIHWRVVKNNPSGILKLHYL